MMIKEKQIKIWCDFNHGHENDIHYLLDTNGSKKDIERYGDLLKDGIQVIISDDEEIEMKAILSYDKNYNIWLAEPVEGTLKYLK